jgi:hypothetical protein
MARALPLALCCAGCLVTNELDFEASRSLLTVDIRSPSSPFPVPTESGECNAGEVQFVARYYYEDVQQTLFVLTYVNDQQVGTFADTAGPDPNGTPEHVPPLICVSRNDLQSTCNRVELFVSDDPARLRAANVAELRSEPRVQKATWFLYGGSTDQEAGGAKPYASFYDCLPPDEGM